LTLPNITGKQAALRLVRGLLRKLGLLVLGALGLHLTLQSLLAAAIALAPHGRLPWAEPPRLAQPPGLALRQTSSIRAPLAGVPGKLAAWVVEPARLSSKGTVVLLHGVRMDKRSLEPMAEALSDAGFRAVLVDLRGHGESDGRYLTYGFGEAADVSQLLDALELPGPGLEPIGVYGFSYGGAVAIDLGARDRRVRSVVAVSPFSSLRQVVGDYRNKYLPAAMNVVPEAWFQGAVDAAARWASFDPDVSAPVRSIANSHAPTLLIHGDADTQVPLRHSQSLLQASAGLAQLVVVRGATHDVMPLDDTGVIRNRVVAWFETTLSKLPR
jgi:pimeloyl-ACP methyl ester carboxylesterase